MPSVVFSRISGPVFFHESLGIGSDFKLLQQGYGWPDPALGDLFLLQRIACSFMPLAGSVQNQLGHPKRFTLFAPFP